MIRRLIPWLLSVSLVILISCGCPQKPEQNLTTQVSVVSIATPRNDIVGLPNFAKVSDSLYRGAQPTKDGFVELKKMGIRTIINLRHSSDRDELKGTGLYYCHISSEPYDVDDNEMVAFLKVVINPVNHPVFVHCEHGADRTGAMVAVYRIYIQNWNKEDALKELDIFGHHRIWKNIPEYIRNFDINKIKLQLQTASEPKMELIE